MIYVGAMIHEAGAGPAPIRHKELRVENLTEAIKFSLFPSTDKAAKQLCAKIRAEVSLYIVINSLRTLSW